MLLLNLVFATLIPSYAVLLGMDYVPCPSGVIGFSKYYDLNEDPSDGAELKVFGIEQDTVYAYFEPGENGALTKVVVGTHVFEGPTMDADFKDVYGSLCEAMIKAETPQLKTREESIGTRPIQVAR